MKQNWNVCRRSYLKLRSVSQSNQGAMVFCQPDHPQAAHKEAMGGVERKLVEEKTRLQREAHAQLMEIKRNTDEEVALAVEPTKG